MTKFYFTFGADKAYPYPNSYVIVVAENIQTAIEIFRKRFPDRSPGVVNCAFWYPEDVWKEKGEKYYGKNSSPAEILWQEDCWGTKPEGYGDVYVFVPEKRQIILIEQGDGEDIDDDEYVDSISYTIFDMEVELQEDDGGSMMLKKCIDDEYSCLSDCIPDLLQFIYGDPFVKCKILA